MPWIMKYIYENGNGELIYTGIPQEEKVDPNDLTNDLDELVALKYYLNKYHTDILRKFDKFYGDFITVSEVRQAMMNGENNEAP